MFSDRKCVSAGQRGPRIIGVLAPGFKLFFPPEPGSTPHPIFGSRTTSATTLPIETCYGRGDRRLKTGVTLRQAQERLDALAPELLKNSFAPAAALRLRADAPAPG